MSRRSRRIALSFHDQSLKVNKFPKTRLPAWIRIIAGRSTDEAHVGYARFLRPINQFSADVVLVLMRRRDKAHGIATGVLQGFGDVPNATGLVRDDFGTETFEFLGLLGVGMHGEPDDCVDFSGEFTMFEDEFGDEEAGLAVDGRDTDFSRHFDEISSDMW